ncbi:MAG TPA: hypothetical protein ENJ30_02805 [Desulfobulbaceae bacterium]|nr:hypothetical protein [Desulfobulbaceae bacterium]
MAHRIVLYSIGTAVLTIVLISLAQASGFVLFHHDALQGLGAAVVGNVGAISLWGTVAIFSIWLLLFVKQIVRLRSKLEAALNIWDALPDHPQKPGRKQWNCKAADCWDDLADIILHKHGRLINHIAATVKIGVCLTAFGMLMVFPTVGGLFQKHQATSPGQALQMLFASGLDTALLSTVIGIVQNIVMQHYRHAIIELLWLKFVRLDEEKNER